MTEQQWTPLCRVDEVPASEQGGRYVLVANRAYAVFRNGDEVRVLDDVCPHAGASLSAGHVDEGCAICPWHGWAFDLSNGVCPDNPAIRVRHHAVRVRDGMVEAQLHEPRTR